MSYTGKLMASPMSALGQKRTFSDTLSNVRYWGQSGHKTDPPPASRYAITSPRHTELIFPGNLRRRKQGRACRFDFLRGKVDRLVVVTEAAMRRRTLGRRFARAGAWESGMGRKKTHFDFFPFLASKPAFFSHAARRSSTVTVVPSACLFQSLDRIIFGMTHTCGDYRTHTSPTISKPCTSGGDVWLVAGSRSERSVRSQTRRLSHAAPATLLYSSACRQRTSRGLRESVEARQRRLVRNRR